MDKKRQTISEVADLMFQQMRVLGYSESTVKWYTRAYKDFVNYVGEDAENADFSERLTAGYVDRYRQKLSTEDAAEKKRLRAKIRLANMLTDCHVHGVIMRNKISEKIIPEPFAEQIEQYCQYLIENGKARGTAERNRFVLEQLAEYLLQKGVDGFERMTTDNLVGFSATQMGYTKKTVAASMYALRSFAKYLKATDKNTALNEGEIPYIRYTRRRYLPKVWSEDECRRLLDNVERNSPAGKRNYAILLLVINYGLRTSDVLGLKLKDIDWRNSCIHFTQQKTGIKNAIVIDEDTGWAIIDYLRNGRPNVDLYPNVFLQAMAPYLPMNNFNICLQRYMELADIHVERKQTHGMHSLRHSLATRLLNNGTPIGTISDILGHANINSSVDYLQIDLDHLRDCALETEV